MFTAISETEIFCSVQSSRDLGYAHLVALQISRALESVGGDIDLGWGHLGATVTAVSEINYNQLYGQLQSHLSAKEIRAYFPFREKHEKICEN